jgi:hypothetical protein
MALDTTEMVADFQMFMRSLLAQAFHDRDVERGVYRRIHWTQAAPTPDLGVDGDYCIDELQWTVYVKNGAAWTAGDALAGADLL